MASPKCGTDDRLPNAVKVGRLSAACAEETSSTIFQQQKKNSPTPWPVQHAIKQSAVASHVAPLLVVHAHDIRSHVAFTGYNNFAERFWPAGQISPDKYDKARLVFAERFWPAGMTKQDWQYMQKEQHKKPRTRQTKKDAKHKKQDTHVGCHAGCEAHVGEHFATTSPLRRATPHRVKVESIPDKLKVESKFCQWVPVTSPPAFLGRALGESVEQVVVGSDHQSDTPRAAGLGLVSKAAVMNDHNNVFFVCNMPEGMCRCKFKTKHDLVQHIIHTDDGYHSLNKMEAVSKLMGTDKEPACAAPDDVEEYFIGTPPDSVIEEKKETEACAPHACMHSDSLTQCMAKPGFAEAFADKRPACAAPEDVEEYFIGTPLVEEHFIGTPFILLKILMKDSETEEKKDTEASAPHAFYTHALTNNCHTQFASTRCQKLIHALPYDEWRNNCPKDVALTNEGSSSEGSCTDEDSGEDTEPNPMNLVHGFVEALATDKDAWVDINRVTEKFGDRDFCMEMIEGLLELNMFMINATRTKVRIKLREDCL